EFEGFVLDGPEYLTVFDGRTGAELDTVCYEPERGDDGLLWGDYAMERIETGKRVDRFLAGVAYLDGYTPTAVFALGYYTLSAVSWPGLPTWTVPPRPLCSHVAITHARPWWPTTGTGRTSASVGPPTADTCRWTTPSTPTRTRARAMIPTWVPWQVRVSTH